MKNWSMKKRGGGPFTFVSVPLLWWQISFLSSQSYITGMLIMLAFHISVFQLVFSVILADLLSLSQHGLSIFSVTELLNLDNFLLSFVYLAWRWITLQKRIIYVHLPRLLRRIHFSPEHGCRVSSDCSMPIMAMYTKHKQEGINHSLQAHNYWPGFHDKSRSVMMIFQGAFSVRRRRQFSTSAVKK